MSIELYTNVDGLLVVQGSLFAVTLYDAIYLYIKLASEVISQGGGKSDITDGTNMYHRAQNRQVRSSECCLLLYGTTINLQTFCVSQLTLPPIRISI